MSGAGRRSLRLNQRHVDFLRRDVPDPGPQLRPGFRPATDDDFRALADAILAEEPPEGFWVFAYGSLIWNPAFRFTEQRVAVAPSWRRKFCLGWDHRFRGSRDTPGLMLALDRGGSCRGVVFRLPPDDLRTELDHLLRREMSMVPSAFPARWISVRTPGGALKALTFAMNRQSGRYVTGLSDDEVAAVLATAHGFRGSMAEYLFSTVAKLEEIGIHDRHLWRLQELVADRIERTNGWNGETSSPA